MNTERGVSWGTGGRFARFVSFFSPFFSVPRNVVLPSDALNSIYKTANRIKETQYFLSVGPPHPTTEACDAIGWERETVVREASTAMLSGKYERSFVFVLCFLLSVSNRAFGHGLRET